MTRIFAAACAFAFLFAAADASAQVRHREGLEVVGYSDLDLNRAAGADTLIRRIKHASEVACFDRPGMMTLREHIAIRRCRAISVENAIAAVDHPVVTARYYRGGYAVIEASNRYPYPDYRY